MALSIKFKRILEIALADRAYSAAFANLLDQPSHVLVQVKIATGAAAPAGFAAALKVGDLVEAIDVSTGVVSAAVCVTAGTLPTLAPALTPAAGDVFKAIRAKLSIV